MNADSEEQKRMSGGPNRSAAGAARDAQRRERLAQAMRENLRRRKAKQAQLDTARTADGTPRPAAR